MYNLLLVDDEDHIREAIKTIVDWNRFGIQLVCDCPNAFTALEQVKKNKIDIIMTDIKMPVMSGLELISEVSRIDKTIKFIVLSGYEDFEFARTAMKLNVNHYLLKPCDEMMIGEALAGVTKELNANDNMKSLATQTNILLHSMKDTVSQNNHQNSYEISCLCDELRENVEQMANMSLISTFYEMHTNAEIDKTVASLEGIMNKDHIDELKEQIAKVYTKEGDNFLILVFIKLFINQMYIGNIDKHHMYDLINTIYCKQLSHDNINLLTEELVNIAKSKNEYLSFVQTIIAYTEENYSNEKICLKYIAKNILYMNEDYISKIFYKQTGQKFNIYLNTMRMEKAKDMFCKLPNSRVQSIAEAIGLGNNPQYFSKLFKKYTGLTPKEYATKFI